MVAPALQAGVCGSYGRSPFTFRVPVRKEESQRKCVGDLPGSGFQKLRATAQRKEPAKRQREAARRQAAHDHTQMGMQPG